MKEEDRSSADKIPGDMSHMGGALDERVFEEQVRHVERLVPLAIIGTLVNALIVVFVLRSVVFPLYLFVWISIILSISVIRLPRIFRKFPSLSNHSNARSLGRFFVRVACLSGTAWGSSALFLFPAASITHQAFLAFVLAGMVAGAVGIYAALPKAFLAFSLPTLIPFIVRCTVIGDEIHLAMAAMAMLFAAITWVSAKRMNAAVESNCKLRFENKDLADYLTDAKSRVDKFNEKLQQEIVDRKRIEQDLRQHETHLSELVEERTGELQSINVRLQNEIDERTRLENELLRAAKLDSLGLLAGGIAHDFNNLLTGILGNLSLALMETDPDGTTHDILRDAQKASLRARDLTQQLLTFSRGGAPIKRTVHLKELIRDSATFALRGSNVTCLFHWAEDLLPVNADKGQMSQVIHNIIINAHQAMSQGGTIRISAENVKGDDQGIPLLPDRSYVKLTVSDQGRGIPQSDLNKVFDPYFSTKHDGSGLGLATTYSIVQKHDGHISLESKLGEGTTFCIFLPAQEEAPPPDVVGETGLVTGQGRVLIMDDDLFVRDVIHLMLTKLGYEPKCVVDGREAIAAYREALSSGQPFRAVIMDLTVPGGMGGLEAVQNLLVLDPEARVLVSSGYSNDPVMAEFRDYGFKGVIKKPYVVEDLADHLSRVLNETDGD